jgi:hypothetical protein
MNALFIDRIFVEVVPKLLSEDPVLTDSLKSVKKHAVSFFYVEEYKYDVHAYCCEGCTDNDRSHLLPIGAHALL